MIYFYHGPDTYQSGQAAEKLKAQYPLVEELDLEQRERLTELLQSQGLFAQRKLVVLRGWVGELKEPPLRSDADILFLENSSPDRRRGFYKWLIKNAEAREFVAPTGAALETWISETVADRGGRIEAAATKELVARIGEAPDLREYSSALEKLMLYSPQIETASVRELVPRNFNDDVFSITNAFAEGRVWEAAATLERLPAEPVQIVGALAAQIRSLLLVKFFERESPAEVAAALGWKEGRVWVSRKLAKNFTAARLRVMLRDLLAIDRRLKTSEEPPKLLLTLFLNKAKA